MLGHCSVDSGWLAGRQGRGCLGKCALAREQKHRRKCYWTHTQPPRCTLRSECLQCNFRIDRPSPYQAGFYLSGRKSPRDKCLLTPGQGASQSFQATPFHSQSHSGVCQAAAGLECGASAGPFISTELLKISRSVIALANIWIADCRRSASLIAPTPFRWDIRRACRMIAR
jgi:hypothetical protein